MSRPGWEICGSCGAVALDKASTCAICEALLSRLRADPLPEDVQVVGVRCRFQCRGCGHLAPLDALNLEGTVRCARCGLEQAFDVESWRPTMKFAHEVADLSGAEARDASLDGHWSFQGGNPHQKLGTGAVWATHALSGEVKRGAQILQRSLEIRAHPGRPLCSCGAPWGLRARADGLDLRCAACGAENSLDRPREANGLEPLFLASFGGSSRAMALGSGGLTGSAGFSCPGCGAPLPVVAGARVATCSFCKLSSPLASATATSDTPPAVWWMVFRGPSDLRRRLLREDGPIKGDPGSIPEPPASQPSRIGWALRQTATWGAPALALGIAAVLLLGGLVLSRYLPR